MATAVKSNGRTPRVPNGDVKEQVPGTSNKEMVVSRKGAMFMTLLALQFGCQPFLHKACIGKTGVSRISLILATETTKIFVCAAAIFSSGERAITDSWTLRKSLRAAAIPAAGYVLQNWLTQCACANLDSLTYNLLNQTKTLFAALCLFLVMGKRQSPMQLVALSLLLGAALILNAGNRDTGGDGTAQDSDDSLQRLWLGILPVLGSAFLSGLFGAVTQRTLQTGYSSFLLSLELAVYGIASLLFTCALGDTCFSGGIQGLFRGWTRWTWVPVLSQAAGGVIVGQVTKHAGSVQKGFSLIVGILVTAVVQVNVENSKLTQIHYAAAALVAGSAYLHANYPYHPPKNLSKVD